VSFCSFHVSLKNIFYTLDSHWQWPSEILYFPTILFTSVIITTVVPSKGPLSQFHNFPVTIILWSWGRSFNCSLFLLTQLGYIWPPSPMYLSECLSCSLSMKPNCIFTLFTLTLNMEASCSSRLLLLTYKEYMLLQPRSKHD
jgi:hypothetical protein